MLGIDTNICKGFEIIAGDWPTDVKLSADGDILTILNILFLYLQLACFL